MPNLKETKSSVIKALYQMMYDVDRIFEGVDLKYWVDGGTFLGAVRHKGIIPWDDDLDVGIEAQDVKKFLSLREKLADCGYSVSKVWFGYKIFYTKNKKLEGFDYSFPFVDVLPFEKVGDEYRLLRRAARDAWPKEVWPESELFPLKKYVFGDMEVWGPAEYENYFDNYYGSDWNHVAYREYDHKKEEEVERVKVKLTSAMRKPALPIGGLKDRKCVRECLDGSEKPGSPIAWAVKPTSRCSRYGGCYDNFDIKMPVYVINCAMHKERMEKFTRFALAANVKACRVPCVLGKKFSHSLICKMMEKGVLDPDADMTKVEVSINMSHYNCWQKLVNSCCQYALILEDDVELKPDFVEKINSVFDALIRKNEHFSILQLWDGHWDEEPGPKRDSSRVPFMNVSPGLRLVKQTDAYNSGAAA